MSRRAGIIGDSAMQDIKEGKDKMYFSGGSLRSKKDFIIAKNYDIFFKLINLLPSKFLLLLLKKKVDKNLYKIPTIFNIFLNFMVLIRNSDNFRRGLDYIFYYLKNIPRIIINKMTNSYEEITKNLVRFYKTRILKYDA